MPKNGAISHNTNHIRAQYRTDDEFALRQKDVRDGFTRLRAGDEIAIEDPLKVTSQRAALARVGTQPELGASHTHGWIL
jgi:hypothetical protein